MPKGKSQPNFLTSPRFLKLVGAMSLVGVAVAILVVVVWVTYVETQRPVEQTSGFMAPNDDPTANLLYLGIIAAVAAMFTAPPIVLGAGIMGYWLINRRSPSTSGVLLLAVVVALIFWFAFLKTWSSLPLVLTVSICAAWAMWYVGRRMAPSPRLVR